MKADNPVDTWTHGHGMARPAKMIEFGRLFAPQIGGKPIFEAFGSNGDFPPGKTGPGLRFVRTAWTVIQQTEFESLTRSPIPQIVRARAIHAFIHKRICLKNF